MTCRVKDCFDKNGNRTGILTQNYGRHLARYHPNEDFHDLSPHSDLRQATLSFTSCQVSKHPGRRDGSGLSTSGVSDIQEEEGVAASDLILTVPTASPESLHLRYRSRSPLRREELSTIEKESENDQPTLEEELGKDRGKENAVVGNRSGEDLFSSGALALQRIIIDLKNKEELEIDDIEDALKAGLFDEVYDKLKGKLENINHYSRKETLGLISGILTLSKASSEDGHDEKVRECAEILLNRIDGENWENLTSREKLIMGALIENVRMPVWVRNCLGLFLRDPVSKDKDVNENAEKEGIKKCSRELDVVIRSVVADHPDAPLVGTASEFGEKLGLIKGHLKVVSAVKDLKTSINQLENLSLRETSDVKVKETPDGESIIKNCRSVREISENIVEFECLRGKVTCLVCGVQCSSYDLSIYETDENSKIDQKLAHLKYTLKRHLSSKHHKARKAECQIEQQVEEKIKKRNQEIGKKLGEICYLLIKNGLPDTLFPYLVRMCVSFGVDLGDLNHSSNFPDKFSVSLADTVKERVRKHLSSPLVSTGCKPPVNIVMDKFTYQHNTKQCTGVVTLTPGSEKFIQALYLESPLCANATGEFMSGKITEVCDKWISPDQYTGSTGDGVYGHCSVPKFLDEHYGSKGFHTWDPMHKAATVGTSMRNPKALHAEKFKWVNKLTDAISEGNKFINFGAGWAEFCQIWKQRKEDDESFEYYLKFPKFNSETRFENYIFMQYSEFRERYQVLLQTLKKIEEELRDGDSTERKRAAAADVLKVKNRY